VQSPTDVRAQVVRRVDEVLRPGERDQAVHDQQLAVVAQVGALPLALERLHRQHRRPQHADPREAPLHLAVALGAPAGDVVEEHAHHDPASRGILEGLEERLGRRIQREDVELDVHILLRGGDLVGHRLQGFLVVRVQLRVVAADHRHRPEVPVQFDDRLEVRRPGRLGAHPVDAVGRVDDVLVDLALLLATPLRQAPVAEQEEQQEAGHGQEEDREQPRHRGLRAPVPRDDDDGEDAQREVDDHEQRRPRHIELELEVLHAPKVLVRRPAPSTARSHKEEH
jgi:hypothetical protein